MRLLIHAFRIVKLTPASSFDIDDRKGLEIIILSALLTFQDANEAYHAPTGEGGGARRKSSATDTPPLATPVATPPPPPPPKPAAKTGVDRIAEVHAIRGDVNEIIVEDAGSVEDYAQYCSNLLQVSSKDEWWVCVRLIRHFSGRCDAVCNREV